MRTPGDFPARRRNPGRARVWLIGAVVLLVLLITWLRGIAGFYTTYLWFQELDFADAWKTMLGTKVLLVVVFSLAFFVLLLANLTIADRVAPRFRLAGDDELVARYRETVGPHAGKVRLVVSLLFGLLVGTNASGQWENWLLFRNAVDFVGAEDPQFHRNVGFYVFKLPFLTFLVDWAFVALVMVLVVTLVAHYLNGGIRLQAPGQRASSAVKAHVSVLLGAIALVKAAGYWLARFELAYSRQGVVDGPTYTDINARLPALTLLAVISLVAVALFVVNIWRQGWVLPVIAVGLWAFLAVVVGSLVPAFIQKFRVEPSEIERERAFISNNIKATQQALGIDTVAVEQYQYDNAISSPELNENAETVRNIRLWDPSLSDINATYQRLQEIRGYYGFEDIDVDRYTVNGRITQTIVSVRELHPDEAAGNSFVNRRLQYTHGYGAIVSPANAVTSDGKPEFIVKDVPPVSSAPEIEITQPRVYYGEASAGYVIVGTKTAELDYQDAKTGETQTSRYEGAGGVRMSSFVRRAAFALRFGDINPLISDQVTPQSKAMYVRDIRSRVREAAPFLKYDSDPYSAIVGGRIVWVQDAYTTTNHYPYAQQVNTERLPAGSGLKTSFNYVRNSVKAVVDAYDGTVTFYVVDDKDPIIKAYNKIFPDLFTPGASMPQELRDHLRYPEDLFRIQTAMYGRYHITDPNDFYLRADEWDLSQDPGSGDPTKALERVQSADPQTGIVRAGRNARMEPVYLLMRLPGQERESFVILQPFVFRSEGDKQQNLAAFVTANSNPGEDFGKLQAFVMPRDQQVDGPLLVHSRMLQDAAVSQTISLLGETSSEVRMGNLLVLPMGNSLLYVRPMYVLATANKVPELQRVIVVSGNRVVIANTLADALTSMFGSAPPTLEEQRAPTSGVPGAPVVPGGPAPSATVAELLQQAEAAYAAAQAALTKGDLAEYQKQVNIMADAVKRARDASANPASA